jgi:hypothetical protein
MSNENKSGRWVSGANEKFDSHTLTVFTDNPQRYPIMHASQSDLASIIGLILDARSDWSAHTSASEMQYQIETAINTVAPPEILVRAESPSGNPEKENRFRQQGENNGLYVTKAWIKPAEPEPGTMDPSKKKDPLERILFADDQEATVKCDMCAGSGTHECRQCGSEHECDECDGDGKIRAYTDEELDRMPVRYALRRLGGKHVIMYDEASSAESALDALRQFNTATLEKWFNERQIQEKTA